MKIAVLTNQGSIFGIKLLNELHSQNIAVDTVIILKQPASYYLTLFRSVLRRTGLVDALYFSARRLMQQNAVPNQWNGKPLIREYHKLAKKVFRAGATNDVRTVECVAQAMPDILLLGQCGIVREAILEIPKRGTLNAHSGVLPFYRGVDCAKWALYSRDFENIGVSVHWVDRGVDTGSVIQIEKHVVHSEKSLSELDISLEDLCVRLLCRIVRDLDRIGTLHCSMQDPHLGKQWYKMPKSVEKKAEKILAEMKRN